LTKCQYKFKKIYKDTFQEISTCYTSIVMICNMQLALLMRPLLAVYYCTQLPLCRYNGTLWH